MSVTIDNGPTAASASESLAADSAEESARAPGAEAAEHPDTAAAAAERPDTPMAAEPTRSDPHAAALAALAAELDAGALTPTQAVDRLVAMTVDEFAPTGEASALRSGLAELLASLATDDPELARMAAGLGGATHGKEAI